jgi:predicted phage baseplate assembly protein
MTRAPAALRARTRAVTADDFEFFALGVPGVARAFCLAPGSQPPQPYEPRPGQVSVLVIPLVEDARGPIPVDRMRLSSALQDAVVRALEPRRPIGIALEVREPQYIVVEVHVVLRLTRRASSTEREESGRDAEALLYRYLNPYTGGPHGKGWPFGRALAVREIFGLLQSIQTVEYVEDVVVRVVGPGDAPSSPRTVEVPPYAVICSSRHEVQVI